MYDMFNKHHAGFVGFESRGDSRGASVFLQVISNSTQCPLPHPSFVGRVGASPQVTLNKAWTFLASPLWSVTVQLSTHGNEVALSFLSALGVPTCLEFLQRVREIVQKQPISEAPDSTLKSHGPLNTLGTDSAPQHCWKVPPASEKSAPVRP